MSLKYDVGDTVKVTSPEGSSSQRYKGKVYEIKSIDYSNDGYKLKGVPEEFYWRDDEVKLVSKKGGISMGKFYRVKQDTPAWLTGAILEHDGDDGYQATSDLWDSFEKNYPSDYTELAAIVENNPDFFERVYEVKLLGKAKYLTKVQAREAHDELYKGKK